jgi:hypothetical protein
MKRDETGTGANQNETTSPNVNDLVEELKAKSAEVRDRFVRFVDERPIASVGIAFGAGYLLAGGLYSKTTARLLKLGTRLAVGLVLRQLVAAGGISALSSLIPPPRTQH